MVGIQAVLCIDSELMRHPDLIGLPDENLVAQSWLAVFSDAMQIRWALLQRPMLKMVWVISSDTMDGLNLAAALKADDTSRKILFVSFEATGSILSRCSAAGIEVIKGVNEFVRSYTAFKQQCKARMILREPISATMITEQVSLENLNMNDQVEGDLCAISPIVSIGGGIPQTMGALQFSRDDQAVGDVFSLSTEDPMQLADAMDPERAEVSQGADVLSAGNISQKVSLKQSEVKSQSDNSTKLTPFLNQNRSTSSLLIDESLLNFSKISLPAKDRKAGYTIAIVSGSGGSGKSAIALCAAALYQIHGFKTLLLDGDLQFGDMSYMLGRDSAFTIVDVMEEPERISHVMPEDGLPAVIAAPENLEHSELVMTHMAEIIDFVKGHFDVVVINTGSFWCEQHAQIIEAANKTLFVLDQRPSSVRACSRALELCSRCGIATQPFAYALNFCSRHALLTSIDVSCALRGVSVHEVKDGGHEVGELLGASLPRELLSSKNGFVQSVQELCIALLPELEQEKMRSTQQLDKTQHKSNPFSSLRKRRVACL